ncbi:MAG: mismatch repair protein MutT [Frankiales bacterium]|nr:mismatch repair protein MutT [Frankiales bacterium]
MAKRSAGILLFRRRAATTGCDAAVEVLLAHTGGPLWARRDEHAWSIPKGELDPEEDPADAARREFAEELGLPPPPGDFFAALGDITQRGGKTVTAWALEAPADDPSFDQAGLERALAARASGSAAMFQMEWPRGSGVQAEFPEVDRVRWFPLAEAAGRLYVGQADFLTRLAALLAGSGPS